MLIDYFYLKQKYNVNASGIIHIGGHHGEELDAYNKDSDIKHVVLFEADPDNFKILKQKVEVLISFFISFIRE